MHIALLILALIVCPVGYIYLILHMRRQKVERRAVIPMLLLFGTIGGWMLTFSFSPSGIAAMGSLFLYTVAPLALILSSVSLAPTSQRNIYHNVAMWSGFVYPVILGVLIVLTGLLG